MNCPSLVTPCRGEGNGQSVEHARRNGLRGGARGSLNGHCLLRTTYLRIDNVFCIWNGPQGLLKWILHEPATIIESQEKPGASQDLTSRFLFIMISSKLQVDY